jgi:predicted ester cyclase
MTWSINWDKTSGYNFANTWPATSPACLNNSGAGPVSGLARSLPLTTGPRLVRLFTGRADDAGMNEPKQIVADFLNEVRSGASPERAADFMAPLVLAHQVVSEDAVTVERTPDQYTQHVRGMLEAYGDFAIRVDELIAEGDRVYARWTQHGRHLTELDGFPATGAPLTEVASAVYRVEGRLIVEYWIQIDRQGMTEQLRRSAT